MILTGRCPGIQYIAAGLINGFRRDSSQTLVITVTFLQKTPGACYLVPQHTVAGAIGMPAPRPVKRGENRDTRGAHGGRQMHDPGVIPKIKTGMLQQRGRFTNR
jgi:hypothetical protein